MTEGNTMNSSGIGYINLITEGRMPRLRWRASWRMIRINKSTSSEQLYHVLFFFYHRS